MFTDLSQEAARVLELFSSRVLVADKHWFAEQRKSVALSPHAYGWKDKGRITAFADEDGFIFVNALGAHLDDLVFRNDAIACEALIALRGMGTRSFTELAQNSFSQMASEPHTCALDPDTVRVFDELLKRGHQIVVVSNSGTDRILSILKDHGLAASAHTDKPTVAVRIRGGARKFVLGDAPDFLDGTSAIAPYTVDTSRPFYRHILEEELPDIVVGDVFSLDLALPIKMATGGLLSRSMGVYLKAQPYTPQWSKTFMTRQPIKEASLVHCNILNSLTELLAAA